MRKTILVTGAFGFIGKYVIKKLLTQNYNIIILTHTKGNDMQENVQLIEADISDKNMVVDVLKKIKHCDIFIHLAANLKMNAGDQTISVNCNGTYHLIQLATMLEAEKFIYISSIPVIGSPRIIPITEQHPVVPESLYHISKYMGEMMLNALGGKSMKKVILRIPSPIGVGMNPTNFLSVLFDKCLSNQDIELFGQGLRIQNYIDVRDVAEAINQVIEYPDSDLFLIAGSKSISNKDLAFLCKRMTNSSSKIIWGEKSDPDEKKKWIISTDKIFQKLHFVPEYSLNDTLMWIYRKRMEVFK